ncbi:MAG TPA: adenylate kinase [Bacteroidales bacterium]|nr:adenylate kinase [Lentimicrobiaceae bacterium]HOH99164.1 adenylate kinase [Bacteroidales bacterium]
MFNLILFGPPGAGKGTQSKNIAVHYGFRHISTGNILRSEIQEGTALGKTVKAFIDQGQLVPDEVLIDILHGVMARNKGVPGFVWDGFPRTIVQAEAFDRLLEECGEKVDLVIALGVQREELLRRLLNRGEEDGRSDDKEEIILQRFDIYQAATLPLIDYYVQRGNFVNIDGVRPIDNVFRDICREIDRLKA